MIEGVNSSLQTSQLLRASVQQASSADVFSADAAPVQKIARAPSVSVYVDIDYDTAVLQFRNVETRDVIDQIPSETLLQYRARDEARRAALQQEAQQPLSETRTQATTSQGAVDGTVSETTAPSSASAQASGPAAPQVADTPTPRTSAPTPQQMAAFASAASAGNTNAGYSAVTVFA